MDLAEDMEDVMGRAVLAYNHIFVLTFEPNCLDEITAFSYELQERNALILAPVGLKESELGDLFIRAEPPKLVHEEWQKLAPEQQQAVYEMTEGQLGMMEALIEEGCQG